AASTKRDAGALNASVRLLDSIDEGPRSGRRAALIQRLRGRIAFDQGHAREASSLLEHSARLLESFDLAMARDTHLEALAAAVWAGGQDGPALIRQAAVTASDAPRCDG